MMRFFARKKKWSKRYKREMVLTGVENKTMEVSTRRRKKSLDESLINPIKSLMGIARHTTKRQNSEDEGIKIDSLVNVRRRRWSRGTDKKEDVLNLNRQRHRSIESEDLLRMKIDDPVLQQRISAYVSQQKLPADTTNQKKEGKQRKISLTNSPKLNAKFKELSAKVHHSHSNHSLSKQETKAEKKTRRKSETEFMNVLHNDKKINISSVKPFPSVKEDYTTIPQNTQLVIKMEHDPVLNAAKRQIKHKRTKSESETFNIANFASKSTSSLLENPLLTDTTDSLYKKKSHKKPPLGRTRSASDTSDGGSPTKHDTSLKKRIKNALARSSSLKESKESVRVDDDECSRSDRSLKDKLKSAVLGRSSSFKDSLEKDKAKAKLKCGSESEIYILTEKQKTITVKRASSLKETRLHNVTVEPLTLDSPRVATVKRSSSAKDNNNKSKRRVPNIMRRLSRSRFRKDSDIDPEIDAWMKGEDEASSLSDLEDQGSSKSDRLTGSLSALTQERGGLVRNALHSSHPTLPTHNNNNNITADDDNNEKHGTEGRTNFPRKLIQQKDIKKHEMNTNRSLSFGNVLDAQYLLTPAKKGTNLKRQWSLRDERNHYLSTCLLSPLVMRASQDGLDHQPSISDEPKVARKRKSLLSPFMRKKSLGREEAALEQKRSVKLDNASLEVLINSILEEKMKDLEYDHTQSNYRCHGLSKSIETAVKERLDTDKEYKIVALVYIGEKREHGIFFATQCCLDPLQDFFATATYQVDNMFVCACVFASLLPDLYGDNIASNVE